MKAPVKQRIDQVLVDRGLVESRQKAQALILAGQVTVDNRKAEKPGQTVSPQSEIRLAAKLPFVSRGGLKLDGALTQFNIDVSGWVCVDVGSSTGGFTDCLLQRGAALVYAIDVGTNQLDWRLRTDPRVIVREQVNARYLRPDDLGESVRLAVCDLSFISLTRVVPVLPPLLTPDGEMVLLVKPQFEVGKGEVGKGGIVREPELHLAACRKVQAAVEQLGFRTEFMDSPVLGAEGNREFLLHAFH
jgi:23S rRNA (cytidine1920-2'-O)/16S rRNA (cytidine1409-2'-O)-methyltransferase